MKAPRVTIGLACYNAADTIRRALDSALAQDWPNIEVIVVDDASSDNSAAIAEAAIAVAPRARLIRHETNSGAAGARNTILGEARGDFIAFFDDDDESLPKRITSQIRRLEAYERQTGAELIACYASGNRRYSNGYVKELPAIGSRGDVAPFGPAVAEHLLFYRHRPGWFYGSGTPTCALLARRSTFIAVGGFDTRLRRVEDIDLAIRLAFAGGHFIGTKETLFIQYATSAAYKSPEKNLEAEQFLAMKNRDYLMSIGRYYYALHWPKLRYWHFRRRYGRFLMELLGLLLHHPLTVASHLLNTGPKRLLHERKLRQTR